MKTNSSKETSAITEIVTLVKMWGGIFFSKWKLILVMFLLGGGYGFYKAVKVNPVYTAELSFSLDEKSSAGGYSGIASQLGLDIGGGGGAGAFSGDNNMELIKSRRIIEKTLLTPVFIDGKEDLLINRYIENSGILENVQDKPELLAALTFTKEQPREKFSRGQDSVVYNIFKSLKNGSVLVTKPDKKLSIFNVKFTSGDEVFAKYFTEALVKNVSMFYIETKTKKFKNNVTILEDRLDSVRMELGRDISSAAILKDQNTNAIRAQGSIQTSKKQLSVQILTTMYGELVKNLEIAKYSLLKEEPIIQVIDYPIFPLEKKVPSKLKATIFGGVVGVFLGLFIVLVLYFKQNYL